MFQLSPCTSKTLALFAAFLHVTVDAAPVKISSASTQVKWITYMDAECTKLPPRNSTVVVDTTVPCNIIPDGSVSSVQCFADHISYTNHPHDPTCSASWAFPNSLPVGKCTEFPGPHRTWKYIDPASYQCGSSNVPAPATPVVKSMTQATDPDSNITRCSSNIPNNNTHAVQFHFFYNAQGGITGQPCPVSCSGTPIMSQFYAIADNTDQCFHWPGHSGQNSMKSGTCDVANKAFSYSQWAGQCECSGAPNAHKTVYATKCVVDQPPHLCSIIADYSACSGGPTPPSPPPSPAPPPSPGCDNKCDTTGQCGDSCANLVQKYSCQTEYCDTCKWAGWCDKQCNMGSCKKVD